MMGGYVMIEGTRVYPDAEPIHDAFSTAARRENAVVGSMMLRDAILRAKGHEIPTRKYKTKPIKPRHEPECCDKCGSPVKPAKMLVSHIQMEVAAYYELHPNTMTSRQQGWEVAHPRQIAMFLAAELTPKSLPEIGRRFGGRDHTTVIHAIRAVKRRMENDPEVAADVMVLREKLEG